MIVELALPAIVPGVLVAAHYLVQASRPRFGHGADARGRRTPTIVGGMAAAALCAFAAAAATTLMRASPWLGGALAALAFAGFGLGIGAAGTGLLTLLAERTAPSRRPAAATLTWLLMIVGFIVCAGMAGMALEPYSPVRLLEVSGGVSLVSMALTALAVWGVEPREAAAAASAPAIPFREALRQVAREPQTVRFALVIFAAMLAYSGQELVLEPLAGAVFGYSPGASTALMGVQRGGMLLGMLLTAAAAGLGARRPGAGGLGGWTAAGCVAAAAGLSMVAAGALRGPGFPIQPAVFVLGLGDGVFAVSAIGAMMARVGEGAPDREGVRMGLWGAAQAIAFGLGGVLATLAVDGVKRALGASAPAYAAALLGEGVLFLVAAALVLRSRQPVPASAEPPLALAPLTS
ncbi:MAG: PucC family protein [Caulobacteraceae bacterium]|nr:PucC family protein [Caulobacter sp.]